MSSFINQFKAGLFSVSEVDFEQKALALFRFQSKNNITYSKYLRHLGINSASIKRTEEIPFLPISFFKHHVIRSVPYKTSVVFQSSGTSGQKTSKHCISDINFYHQNAQFIFERFYGKLSDFEILALLPSYLERSDSSLVNMIQFFMAQSGNASGFYLNNLDKLKEKILFLQKKARPILLLGVTFALLEFAEKYPIHLTNTLIMETGGMKGKRQEITREEVHNILKQSFGCSTIHSEYGMTELLSQAYAKQNGIFEIPPQMRIFLRELNDPFTINNQLRNGGINIIDLANIESCAFIETQDIGCFANNGFRILGRFDNSDIRGCNLMTFL